MTPRRLLPYLLLFLALAGAYAALRIHEERREARERQANKVFKVKEGDLTEVLLVRGREEVRLEKQDQEWRLTRPITAKADQQVVASWLATMANLTKERDLGVQEDLKPFGVAPPALRVEFAAQGQAYRLSLGSAAPTDRSYYALKDQEPNLLLISAGDKESLDRPLAAFRDKTLFTFRPDKVKSLRITRGDRVVQLEHAGPQTWRRVGQEGFKVRADKVEALLRLLAVARVKDFVAEAPEDLQAYGLAPKPMAVVKVATEKEEEGLALGKKTDKGVFARRGGAGPVVLVEEDLPEQIARILSSLEDRGSAPPEKKE